MMPFISRSLLGLLFWLVLLAMRICPKWLEDACRSLNPSNPIDHTEHE
jgi:hypothetical protein